MFPWLMFCINFLQKMGWATFWAIFSKSLLVTLLVVKNRGRKLPATLTCESMREIATTTKKIGKREMNHLQLKGFDSASMHSCVKRGTPGFVRINGRPNFHSYDFLRFCSTAKKLARI
jgi:hypothetical protein